MGTWGHGDMGDVGRDVETWGRGDMGTWGHGDVGRDVETWGHGDVGGTLGGTWGRGDVGTWGTLGGTWGRGDMGTLGGMWRSIKNHKLSDLPFKSVLRPYRSFMVVISLFIFSLV